MGIVVSKENYEYLQKATRASYPKRVADTIVQSICGALACNGRWVHQNVDKTIKAAQEFKVQIPREDFPEKEFDVGFKLKKENNNFFRWFESEEGVVRGWHRAIMDDLKEEGIKVDEKLTNFIYQHGQHVVKTNSPYPKKQTKNAFSKLKQEA